MPDTSINPTSLVVNGAEVSVSNPIPVVIVAAGTPVSGRTINPRTWIVNGAPVSEDNPLPLTPA